VFTQITPARVIYVSCNPDALATELPVILKSGYRVTRVQPVDMFPHTDHIETVTVFARG
jgi:23S rRNA (uracil1939-C5)-methyltransferase